MSQNKVVAIIDYGMGNLHSAAKAIDAVADGEKVIVTSNQQEILSADRVVLPGVGAIRDCMGEIRRLKLDEVVADIEKQGKPLLGICIGMQALMDKSEENDGVECLSRIKGQVKGFPIPHNCTTSGRLKVPHMGWSRVQQQDHTHPLWRDIPDGSRFYFVHSYYVQPDIESVIAGSTEYGLPFAAAVHQATTFAVQFHPEKSHNMGLQLLQNFLQWQP